MTDQVTNHVDQSLDLRLEQFRDSGDMAAMIESYAEQIQEIEDMLFALLEDRTLADAVGEQLDVIGRILGEPRRDRTDSPYRAALVLRIAILFSSGTPEEILEIIGETVIGTEDLHLIESSPAQFELIDSTILADPAGWYVNYVLQQIKAAGVRAVFRFHALEPAFTCDGPAGGGFGIGYWASALDSIGDGATPGEWIGRRDPTSGEVYAGVAFGGDEGDQNLVMVGGVGTIVTGRDTVNLTQRAPAGAWGGEFSGCVWDPVTKNWIVIGEGLEVQTSGIGIVWSNEFSGPADFTAIATKLVAGGEHIVAVGHAGICYTSNDASTFIQRTIIGSDDIYGVAVSPTGRWCAVGEQIIHTSDDAITWAPVSNIYLYTAVCWSDLLSAFVALSDRGGVAVASISVDGVTWVDTTIADTVGLPTAVCSDSDRILIGTSNGNLFMSTDGETWAEQEIGATASIRSIAVSTEGPIWCIVCNNGEIFSTRY